MYHDFWLAKPYRLANQKLCYIQMRLNIEKSGEQGREHAKDFDNLKVSQILIPHGLAKLKLCYIQIVAKYRKVWRTRSRTC